MSGAEFIEQFAVDLGPDAIGHRAGAVVGRARLMTDASSGVEVGILEVLGGHGVRCRDPHRVRRSRRLAMGARDVAGAGSGLSA